MGKAEKRNPLLIGYSVTLFTLFMSILNYDALLRIMLSFVLSPVISLILIALYEVIEGFCLHEKLEAELFQRSIKTEEFLYLLKLHFYLFDHTESRDDCEICAHSSARIIHEINKWLKED